MCRRSFLLRFFSISLYLFFFLAPYARDNGGSSRNERSARVAIHRRDGRCAQFCTRVSRSGSFGCNLCADRRHLYITHTAIYVCVAPIYYVNICWSGICRFRSLLFSFFLSLKPIRKRCASYVSSLSGVGEPP